MTNNIRKYLEYGLFIILNIGLIAPIYVLLLLFLIPSLSILIATKILKVPIYLINNFDDPTALLIGIILFFVFLSLKPLIFNIIYLSKIFPNINTRFENLRNNGKYALFTIISAFLLDFISYAICQYIFIFYLNIHINLLLFMLIFGLCFNYLSFLLFFPPCYKDNKFTIKTKSIKFIIKLILGTLKLIIIFTFILFFIIFIIFIIPDLLFFLA